MTEDQETIFTIWAILIDTKYKIKGELIKLRIPATNAIFDMRELVKQTVDPICRGYSSTELKVWKVENPVAWSPPQPVVRRSTRAGRSGNQTLTTEPLSNDKVSDKVSVKIETILESMKSEDDTNVNGYAWLLNGQTLIADCGFIIDDPGVQAIVQFPGPREVQSPAQKRPGDMEPPEPSKRTKYRQAQDRNVEAARQVAQVENILSQQGKYPVYNGRPGELSGPPIGLFHSVFNDFERGLKENDPIDIDIRKNVRSLIEASTNVYYGEKGRMEAITPFLTTLFSGELLVTSKSNVQSDGVLLAKSIRDWNAYILIFELKNEIGAGGSDPYMQASRAFQKYWCAANDKLRLSCYCPSILISMAGPWMCVSGGVYLEHPIVQPLTDYLWIGERALGSASEQSRLERIFHCLKKAVESLRVYYTNTLPQSALNPGFEVPCGYPYICKFENGRTFSYEDKLDSEFKEKQVFKVKEGGEFRVVKFATTYNEVAHQLLAEEINGESFAPALHHISSEMYGRRRMIVMDYVEGQKASIGSLSSDQIEHLKKAIKRLHDNGFVFGDLREQNIFTCGESVMLIDFDWCGKDREATYPIDLNMSGIDWPRGVGPGEVMLKEHDDVMLGKLQAGLL